MFEQQRYRRGRVQLKEPKGFDVTFQLKGINKNILEEIIRLVICKSEISTIHQISYWKINQDNHVRGIIILKRKWQKNTFPNLSFHYHNQTIFSNVQGYIINKYNNVEKSMRKDADFILDTNDKEFKPDNQKSNDDNKEHFPKKYETAIIDIRNIEVNQKNTKIKRDRINDKRKYIKKKDYILSNETVLQESSVSDQSFDEKEIIVDDMPQKIYNQEMQIIQEQNEFLKNFKNKENQKNQKEQEKQQYIIAKGGFEQLFQQKEENIALSEEEYPFKFMLSQKVLNNIWQLYLSKAQSTVNLNESFILKLNQCLFGQSLPTDFLQLYLEQLKIKYSSNQNVHIVGIIHGQKQLNPTLFSYDIERVKQIMKSRRGNYMFLYLDDNHSSLIIYNLKLNQTNHLDSRVGTEKNHILNLKLQLQSFLYQIFNVNQTELLKYFSEDPEDFWNKIKIMKCPIQVNENDSHYFCLRNMHEFLIQDNLEVDLQRAYKIIEIQNYRLFVTSCIINEKYLNSL